MCEWHENYKLSIHTPSNQRAPMEIPKDMRPQSKYAPSR